MQDRFRTFTVGEFRGGYPTIDVDPRVNLDALTKNDDDPFYVTLPIARIGEVSSNGLFYDEELVKAIEEQVVGKGGTMGHIKPEERNTAFPVEDVDWVGVTRENGTTWGKAYVPPGSAREYLRRLMARGGKLATSIYGPYEKRETHGKSSYKMRGFKLESLDLAPADRAALQLGGQFAITAQMELDDNLESDDMNREEIIAELTTEDIPQNLREQIIQGWREEGDKQDLVSELENERDDGLKIIAELQGRLEAYETQEFEATLDGKLAKLVDWQVKGDEAEKKVTSFKSTLRNRILSELSGKTSQEDIDAVSAEVWDEMKPIAETIRDALTGPPAVVSSKVKNSMKLEDTPEARARARAATGI